MVAGSSTEAEFMAACDTGKMILFIRSILWDLHVPQEAATVLFEDNDGCTALGNAQNPPLALDTSTLNTSPSVNGSSATS